jgi:hypothetical protein
MHAEIFAQVSKAIANLHQACGPSPWTLETNDIEQTIRLRLGDHRAVVADCGGVRIPPNVTPIDVAFEAYTKLCALR